MTWLVVALGVALGIALAFFAFALFVGWLAREVEQAFGDYARPDDHEMIDGSVP